MPQMHILGDPEKPHVSMFSSQLNPKVNPYDLLNLVLQKSCLTREFKMHIFGDSKTTFYGFHVSLMNPRLCRNVELPRAF